MDELKAHLRRESGEPDEDFDNFGNAEEDILDSGILGESG